MANNLTGLNLATRTGEGGADVMTWGNLDAAANRMYAEQKQKEQQGLKEYELAQQELSKEFTKVRSADIPDLSKKYDNVKRIRQEMLFNPKIKGDAIAYANKQQELNLALQDFRLGTTESAEVKELDNQLAKRLSTNRDEFDDEKVPTLFEAFKMPTSQRKEKNLIGAEPFRYTGMDMKGLASLSKSAMGSVQKVKFGEEKEIDDGYNFEQKFIGRTNDPVQYATNMYKGMQTNKYTQGARAALSQMSPIQINQIQSAYNAIPDAEFEARWGRKKEDLVKAFSANPDDKVGQYVTLDAMQYAVNNMPKEVESKKRKNDKFVDEKKKSEYDRRFKLQEGGKNFRAAILAKGGGQLDPDVAVEEIYDLGQETNLGYRIKAGGDLVYGREVTLTPELESDFFDKRNGAVQRPNHTVMSHDKTKIYLVYKDEDGNVNEKKSRIVNVPTDLKASISKNYGGSVFTRKNLFTGKKSAPATKTTATTKGKVR